MPSDESFENLVRQTRQRAYNFAFRLTGNESDAADLMQEAYKQAFQAFDSFDASRPFLPWVLRIIHNLYINQMKSAETRRTVSLDESFPAQSQDQPSGADAFSTSDPGPQDVLLRREEDDLIQRALDSLEPHYRAAVILCDLEGWSYEEIAQALNCPIGTVKSRIFQGRKKIRTFYDGLDAARSRS